MIWIIGIVAIIVTLMLAFSGMAVLLDHRDEKRRTANNESLLTHVREILSSDWHNNSELREAIKANTNGRLHKLDAELFKQMQEAANQIRAEEERDKQLKVLLKLHTTYLEAESTTEKIDALVAMYGRLDALSYDLCREEFHCASGLDKPEVQRLIKQLIHELTSSLTADAREGHNPEAFRKLCLWRHDCRYKGYRRGRYHTFAPSEGWLPNDWNELVARYLPNPHLDDFSGVGELPIGQLRLRAAEALRDQNLTEAKITLAWCNFDPKLRVEVGDVLTADLAKFIATGAKRRSEQQG